MKQYGRIAHWFQQVVLGHYISVDNDPKQLPVWDLEDRYSLTCVLQDSFPLSLAILFDVINEDSVFHCRPSPSVQPVLHSGRRVWIPSHSLAPLCELKFEIIEDPSQERFSFSFSFYRGWAACLLKLLQLIMCSRVGIHVIALGWRSRWCNFWSHAWNFCWPLINVRVLLFVWMATARLRGYNIGLTGCGQLCYSGVKNVINFYGPKFKFDNCQREESWP